MSNSANLLPHVPRAAFKWLQCGLSCRHTQLNRQGWQGQREGGGAGLGMYLFYLCGKAGRAAQGMLFDAALGLMISMKDKHDLQSSCGVSTTCHATYPGQGRSC